MKVQVSMTLELDAKDLKSYMSDLGCDDETVAEYVRSYAISAIPAMLSENLRDNGYQSTVDVSKSNYDENLQKARLYSLEMSRSRR